MEKYYQKHFKWTSLLFQISGNVYLLLYMLHNEGKIVRFFGHVKILAASL